MALILIVEDNEVFAELWQQTLAADGHDVDWAASSPEAMALVDQRAYDLCIVDLVLGNPMQGTYDSGRFFLRHLRAGVRTRNQTIPVIGVSGFKPAGDMKTAQNLLSLYNITRFLLKPFGVEDLRTAVREALEAS